MNPNNREYTNGEITVYWKPAKCIHATTCFRELLEVFNPRNRPWINMKGASTKRIIEVTDKCPTQAIYWKYNKDIKGTPKVQPPVDEPEITPEDVFAMKDEKSSRITIMRDGPILVEGNFKIINSDGAELKAMVMTSFCRCGNSQSQPFCDGSHRKYKFSD